MGLHPLPLHQLPEEAEEGEGGHRGGSKIAGRLRQEYGHGLIREEGRENENQRDQQNELAQAGHQQAYFRLAKSHKCLLAADLEAHGEGAGQENPNGPAGITDKLRVVGEDPRKEPGKRHQRRPEHSGVGHAHGKLAEESLLHPLQLSRAVVVADEGLTPLTDAGKGHGDQLIDGGQHRHGTHRHIPAVAGQGGGKAHRENALGGHHHEAGQPQPQAGQNHLALQAHIPGLQPEDGLFPGEKPQDPYRADRLAQHRGNGRAPDAQLQAKHQNGIQHNVNYRANDRGEHTHPGEALGGDEGIHTHDDQHKHAAQQINPSVGYGVGKGGVAGAEEPQQRRSVFQQRRRKHHGQTQKNRKAVAHDPLGGVRIPLAHGNGGPWRASRPCQHGEGRNQHEDGGEQSHPRQCRGADLRQVTDIDSVHNIVQQVHQLSYQRRHRHFGHQLLHTAGAHILLSVSGHECHPSLVRND